MQIDRDSLPVSLIQVRAAMVSEPNIREEQVMQRGALEIGRRLSKSLDTTHLFTCVETVNKCSCLRASVSELSMMCSKA